MLKALVTSAAIIGMVAGSAIAGPMLMGDGDLDTIVAGKKPQSTGGTGTDGAGDRCSVDNCVYEYTHTQSGNTVYQDWDSGVSTNKNLENCRIGFFSDNGVFVGESDC